MDDIKEIGVSIKVVVYRDDGRLLALQRAKTALWRPLFWDLPGGKLEVGEDLEHGAIREVKEESGLEIQEPKLLHAISAFSRDKFWVTIAYKAVAASEDVRLNPEHGSFQWVTPEEFSNLEASPRNKEFVEKFKNTRDENSG